MTAAAIPRERVVLMLLAAGPASRGELARDTGWGIGETREVVDRLVAEGRVVPFPGSGSAQHGSVVLCLPQARENALKERRAAQVEHIRGYMRERRARERARLAL